MQEKKKKKGLVNTKIVLALESKMLVSVIEKTLSGFEVVDGRLRSWNFF